MDDQEYLNNPDEYFGEIPEEAVSEAGTSLARSSSIAPVAAGAKSSRAMRKLENRVEMEAANSRAFARLSGELIMNTVAITALGEQAVKNAPGAQKAIEHIINVYAASGVAGLAERWSLWHR